MDADATTDPKFEIGHVLFVDIVGDSKLLIGEQIELVRELKEVVATSQQALLRKDKADWSHYQLATASRWFFAIAPKLRSARSRSRTR